MECVVYLVFMAGQPKKRAAIQAAIEAARAEAFAAGASQPVVAGDELTMERVLSALDVGGNMSAGARVLGVTPERLRSWVKGRTDSEQVEIESQLEQCREGLVDLAEDVVRGRLSTGDPGMAMWVLGHNRVASRRGYGNQVQEVRSTSVSAQLTGDDARKVAAEVMVNRLEKFRLIRDRANELAKKVGGEVYDMSKLGEGIRVMRAELEKPSVPPVRELVPMEKPKVELPKSELGGAPMVPVSEWGQMTPALGRRRSDLPEADY